MTTPNIYLQVVLLCLGTQTLCGRNEPPKQDANLTFYVPGLKSRPNDLEMQYLLLPNDDNTEYKFIGRSLMSRHTNPLQLK